MYIHEEMLLSCMKIGKKEKMNTIDIAAEMAQAIHVMLTLSEVGLAKYIEALKNAKLDKRS